MTQSMTSGLTAGRLHPIKVALDIQNRMSRTENPTKSMKKRGGTMKKLNEDETIMLISFVKSRECLWNEGNADFKRISVTRKLWAEIGDQLNISGDEAKIKWRNLRDKFKKRVNLQNQEESNLDTGSQWNLYNAMLFLKDSMHNSDPTIAHSNSIANNLVTPNTSSSGRVDEDFQEYNFDFLVTRKTPPETDTLLSATSPQSVSKSRGQWGVRGGVKRKHGTTSNHATAECNVSDKFPQQQPEELKLPTAVAMSTFQEEKIKSEDDDYYFLMSLLPYIQALNSVEKLELRSQMQSLVTNSYKKHHLNKHLKMSQ